MSDETKRDPGDSARATGPLVVPAGGRQLVRAAGRWVPERDAVACFFGAVPSRSRRIRVPSPTRNRFPTSSVGPTGAWHYEQPGRTARAYGATPLPGRPPYGSAEAYVPAALSG